MMSGFSSIALPGSIPSSGGGKDITPEKLFKNESERAAYRRLLDGGGRQNTFKVKKVRVKIFDLSDEKQVKKYEKLWAELLEKSGRLEVVVESHKDLVHRADGTSYWMKYVEYVEFADSEDDSGS